MNDLNKLRYHLSVHLFKNLGEWQKITHHPICIKARFDEYATLRHHGKPGFLAAVKFVHSSGHIRCHNAKVHNSNWGCSHTVQSNLGIFLTDWKNHVIFPTKAQAEFAAQRQWWYGMAGYDSTSPELVMSNFANPIYLNEDQRLRLWYGEDLFDRSEEDNHGKVCMHIYGYFL